MTAILLWRSIVSLLPILSESREQATQELRESSRRWPVLFIMVILLLAAGEVKSKGTPAKLNPDVLDMWLSAGFGVAATAVLVGGTSAVLGLLESNSAHTDEGVVYCAAGLCVAAGYAPIAAHLRHRWRGRIAASGVCLSFGYDLRKVDHRQCPECGATVHSSHG